MDGTIISYDLLKLWKISRRTETESTINSEYVCSLRNNYFIKWSSGKETRLSDEQKIF